MQVNANSVNRQKHLQRLPVFLRLNKGQSVELKISSPAEFYSCTTLSADSSAGGEAGGPTHI